MSSPSASWLFFYPSPPIVGVDCEWRWSLHHRWNGGTWLFVSFNNIPRSILSECFGYLDIVLYGSKSSWKICWECCYCRYKTTPCIVLIIAPRFIERITTWSFWEWVLFRSLVKNVHSSTVYSYFFTATKNMEYVGETLACGPRFGEWMGSIDSRLRRFGRVMLVQWFPSIPI